MINHLKEQNPLNNVLVSMYYDSSLTLTENKINIFEQEPESRGGLERYGYRWDKPETLDPAQKKLSQFINYVKDNYDNFFEQLREGLLSGKGMVLQFILEFFPAGRVGVAIAWGLLAMYDGAKYYQTKNSHYLVELVIDILSLMTGGIFGKMIGKITAPAMSKIPQILEWFVTSKLGSKVIPILKTIGENISQGIEYLKMAKDLVVNKLNLKWLGTWIESTISNLKLISEWIMNQFKKLLKKISISRTGRNIIYRVLESDVAKWVLNNVSNLSSDITVMISKLEAQRIAVSAGQQISAGEWKAVVSYSEDYLRDKPMVEVLSQIDNKFGTKMAKAYAWAIATYKYKKESLKEKIKSPDIWKEIFKGNFPWESKGKYSNKSIEYGDEIVK